MADINNDGIADLIIGAPTATVSGKANAGIVYVVYGTKSIFSGTLLLTGLNGTNGFEIDGANAGDKIGSSLASGDITGDGIRDFIIGAPGYNSNAGAVYVVFGKTAAFSNPFAISSLDGTNGFRIDTNTGDTSTGTSVASGDINGDNISDVIIGVPASGTNAGAAYVVFGKSTAWTTPFALSTIAGTNGFKISGSSFSKIHFGLELEGMSSIFQTSLSPIASAL